MKREPDCYRNLYMAAETVDSDKFTTFVGSRWHKLRTDADWVSFKMTLPRVAVIRVYMKNTR